MRVALLAGLVLMTGLLVADTAVAPGGFVTVCASPTICAGPIGANVNSTFCRPLLSQGAFGAYASAWLCL